MSADEAAAAMRGEDTEEEGEMAPAPRLGYHGVVLSMTPAAIASRRRRELLKQQRLNGGEVPTAKPAAASSSSKKKSSTSHATAAAPSRKSGGGGSANAHPAAAHAVASSAASISGSSPKRLKRAHPSHSEAHTDGLDEVTGTAVGPAASSSNSGGGGGSSSSAPHVPSPSVWSILSDFVYLPRFLSLVHAQLATARSSHINFHMLASAFRQKLVEGGWAKEQHYVLKGNIANAVAPAVVKDEATAAASATDATTDATIPDVYLLKSRRLISDFTPTVCQQLWRLIAYHRDPSPQAAMDMLAAGNKHRQLEAQCRELSLPLLVGGKVTQAPQGPALKLERMFGLPPGGPDVTDRKKFAATASAAAASSSSAAAAASASPSTPAPAVADGGGDDDSDVEDTFEFWPGIFADMPAHGSHHRIDGNTIQKWVNGFHVHVPQVTQGLSCFMPDTPLAPVVTDPSQAALVQQMSSRSAMVARTNDLHKTFRSHVARNHMHLDWGTGDWGELPSAAHFVQKGATLTSSERPPPMWSSPGDDLNLLDGIYDWLVRQPLPTKEFLKNAAPGQEAAALLPQITSDWLEIRHAISALDFPLAFLRRRWWLLCEQAHLFDTGRANGTLVPPYPNPSMDKITTRVGGVTKIITQRIGEYVRMEQAAVAKRIALVQQQQQLQQLQAAAQAAAQAPATPTLAAQAQQAPSPMRLQPESQLQEQQPQPQQQDLPVPAATESTPSLAAPLAEPSAVVMSDAVEPAATSDAPAAAATATALA